ncbi:HAMP domain-containing protein [Deinococcus sonorensis]|uniref:histidine kinase n=1 Tax=Deinococcus sonorensis KR-87 TaxID=694439 RepID=A0AAU7UGR3_9DEIO
MFQTIRTQEGQAKAAQLRSTATPAGRGLLARLLAITVLPVMAVGLFVALLLGAQRMSALRAVDDSLAGTVARILATTLDVSDLSQVAAQLQAAVTAENVAFVDVRPAGDSLRFFRSKSPETDWALRAAYDAAEAADPGDHRFVFDDRRAELYRQAAQQVQDPAVRERLNRVAAAMTPGERVYQVVRVGVYENRQGQRLVRLPGDAAPAGPLIFELGVGVNNAVIERLLGRQQWLVVGACLLAALLAAGLAWRATGRIVRPIVQLTRAADRLSLGELGEPVSLALAGRSITELSELAQALDRLRTSLALAMSRLRPHPGALKSGPVPPGGRRDP